MSSLLDKHIVLRLNANWQAIGFSTVREAVVFLCSESDGKHPGYALDYCTIDGEDGQTQLQYANPLVWEEWIQLPVREGDLAITTARGQIRCPLAVVCAHYNRIPIISPRLTREAVLERDGYTCQYSGRKLPKAQLNLDHVVPRDRGGKDDWGNLVACDKELNTLKGNRLNSEIGYKLIRKPEAPKARAKVLTAQDAKHPSQRPFLL